MLGDLTMEKSASTPYTLGPFTAWHVITVNILVG